MATASKHSEFQFPVSMARVSLAVVAMVVVFATLIFMPAGRLDWPLGWIYLAIVFSYVAIAWVCLLRWNPELIERRMHFRKGTKTWDKVWAVLFSPLMIAVYAVAGVEARDPVMSLPAGLWPLGLVIFIAGATLLNWAMVVNPFFEKTVRIQTEHGHHVIDTGPYAYVRHPGYTGFVGWILATPFLLNAAWAFIPVLLAVVGIIIRTALEDRTLQAELPGYLDYTKRVRFRLIPGVW